MSTVTSDNNHRNGLLLYFHNYSYYSQKVIMALHEKNLSYDSHFVNIVTGEQYEPWYLQLNPTGEVPVLQDTGKIIPDSTRIIDYLEDNFSNGERPRLIPMDQGSDVRQRVTYFRHLIDSLPAAIITIGSFHHTDLVNKPKLPFILPARNLMKSSEENSSKKLRELAENSPNFKEILLQKAARQESNHIAIVNKEEFLKVLKTVDNALGEVEEDLSKHTGDKANWWLCSDRFTVADISLAILLYRLYEVGLESHFWTTGRRPFIEKYFERVKSRESFKKAVPTLYIHAKLFANLQKPLLIGLSVAAAIAIVIGGVFLVRKLTEEQ